MAGPSRRLGQSPSSRPYARNRQSRQTSGTRVIRSLEMCQVLVVKRGSLDEQQTPHPYANLDGCWVDTRSETGLEMQPD